MRATNPTPPAHLARPAVPRKVAHKRNAYARANGRPTYVDPVETVVHVHHLMRIDLTYQMIADAAQVSPSVILSLATEQRKRIHRNVADAVLAVDHRPSPLQLNALSVGAERRAHALAALGHPMTWQAHQLGATLNCYRLKLDKPRMRFDFWLLVAGLYDEFSHVPGSSGMSRAMARRKGWLAPLAWEGLDIDDPATDPELEGDAGGVDEVAVDLACEGQPVALRTNERDAAIARLTVAGRSAVQIGALLRISSRTVIRIRGIQEHDGRRSA